MLEPFYDFISYFISKFFNLFVWRKLPDMANRLRINVNAVNVNKSVPLDIDPHWTISQIKDLLAPKINVKSNEIRIIFAGRELDNTFRIEDCDIGQQSMIHVVTATKSSLNDEVASTSASSSSTNAALLSTVLQQKLSESDLRDTTCSQEMRNVHFFIYCSSICKNVRPGKLRVRCSECKSGTLIVNQDPSSWEDVLLPKRVTGECQSDGCDGRFAEFFFKCADHESSNEDSCVALYLIRPNLRQMPCLACMDVSNPVLVFPCELHHNMCLSCFQIYCISRLNERRFTQDKEFGYTLPCPIGCPGSLIQETHHFKLLGDEQYSRYQLFATEECLLQNGGVICPQPGCGAGILPDEECRRITCVQQGGQGCGFVFCRNCLQGYHIGECIEDDRAHTSGTQFGDAFHTESDRWDEASKVTIKVITKPCPKCRTPTERDGGCMHMVCSRSQCGFNWCWVCQEEWTRNCMGSHWFG